jgi:membrane protein
MIGYARWPIMLVLAMIALAILYRHGPSRRLARPRWITLGSLTAAFAWLLMSAAFSWYLRHVADYTATYGALDAGGKRRDQSQKGEECNRPPRPG